ncbi:DBP2 [Hepatospora eriocheir]|uniref:RNA helicase n=1 Tax=Hepatospora eriocheir TaxID=1081669 RepID=A0A1X0QGY4_9MICR|nr:DBP2 [Hepatospora eriocheir]
MFDMSSLAVYGGVSYNEQYKKLRRGVEILVATPGRLFDLCDRNFCDLSRVTFMVIDEADRMLDMGFKPQLDKIVPRTNKNRQTLMWSATWPKEVRNLANSYMGTNDYCQIFIGSTELTVKANVKQIVEVVSVHDKIKKLQLVLSSQQDEIGGRVIIFCNQKSRCNNMEYMLQDKGIKAAAIHGDKTQSARTAIINNFKDGRVPILIATDVAARGLDIEDVKMVINYDLPVNVEDYVHRVGRTARGNVKEGMSFSFFSPEEDGGNARKYIELFEKGKVDIPREIYDIADRSAPRRQTRYSSFSRGNNSFNNSYRRNNYSNDNFNRRSDNYYGSNKRY